MQPMFKKITSKFFHHYQLLLKEKKENNVIIQLEQFERRTYSEEERLLAYKKIGSKIELIENNILDKTEKNAYQNVEKDMKKMYF